MIIAVAKPVLSFAACAFILTFFPLRYNPHGWEFVLMVAGLSPFAYHPAAPSDWRRSAKSASSRKPQPSLWNVLQMGMILRLGIWLSGDFPGDGSTLIAPAGQARVYCEH
jgi:hypothetical protein